MLEDQEPTNRIIFQVLPEVTPKFDIEVVTETSVINTVTVWRTGDTDLSAHKDYGNPAMTCMSVSAQGTLIFSIRRLEKVPTSQSSGKLHIHNSVHIVDKGIPKTIVQPTSDLMYGTAFLTVSGQELLLINYMPNIYVTHRPIIPHRQELDKKSLRYLGRLLVHVSHDTPLSRIGDNKAVYIQRTEKVGYFELNQIEVTPDTWHYKSLGTYYLGFEENQIMDMCAVQDLVILLGSFDGTGQDATLVAVSPSNFQIKWKIMLPGAFSVCQGTPCTLFAVRVDNCIVQLTLHDGSVIGNIPLEPSIVNPSCVCYHNGILYVSHCDNKGKSGENKHYNISQLQLNTGRLPKSKMQTQ